MQRSATHSRTAVVDRHPVESTPWSLTDSEIHFLWWFIQGSIMVPETRWRLRHAWGMCERHACGFLAIEATFRRGWVHAAAVLYDDLMERALERFPSGGPFRAQRLRWQLRDRGPCLMCEEGFGKPSAQETSFAPADVLEQARNLEHLRTFADSTRPWWERWVCGRCMACAAKARCRRHLLAERQSLDLGEQRALVTEIAQHVKTYERSFRFECRGSETEADRAGLIGALGWCSGWRAWLQIAG